MGKKWALYDFDGELVRIVNTPIEGAMPYPPPPKALPLDDPEWHNPPF